MGGVTSPRLDIRKRAVRLCGWMRGGGTPPTRAEKVWLWAGCPHPAWIERQLTMTLNAAPSGCAHPFSAGYGDVFDSHGGQGDYCLSYDMVSGHAKGAKD